MTGPHFGYAEVGRFGLAHSLLAWARCAIWCHESGARMLAPHWLRLRIGPLLRGERDKRTYFIAFDSAAYISGLRRDWILWTRRHISAEAPDPNAQPPERSVMVFENALADNEKKHFHHVRGHSAFLRRELTRMTRPAYRPKPADAPFIAVHVRLGDFTAVAEGAAIGAAGNNVRLPIEWYADRIGALHAALGDLPVVVFSDGTDEELDALLRLPSVSRAPKQAAVTDLLSIAQAAVLVSSGSGFSLWGAFLGEVPRVCFPGQSVVRAYADDSMETELAAGDPVPPDLLAQVVKRLWS